MGSFHVHKQTFHVLKVESHKINIKDIKEFKVKLESLLTLGVNHLVLDLEEVEYLNSSALGVIARTAMEARELGKELVISGCRPSLLKLFHIVKFNQFMRLFSDQKEAESYFQSKPC